MLPRTLQPRPRQDERLIARLVPGTYFFWSDAIPDEVETYPTIFMHHPLPATPAGARPGSSA
jgi:hypothetical protein